MITHDGEKKIIVTMGLLPTDPPWTVSFVGLWTPQQVHLARLAISDRYRATVREFLYTQKRVKQKARHESIEGKRKQREEKAEGLQEEIPEVENKVIESLTVKDST